MRNTLNDLVVKISGIIFRFKEISLQSGPLKTIGLSLVIIFLEIFLAIVSLPLYITKSYVQDPDFFNQRGMSYAAFRARRRWTLATVLLYIIIVIISYFSTTLYLFIQGSRY